jgi:hypothetical protein
MLLSLKRSTQQNGICVGGLTVLNSEVYQFGEPAGDGMYVSICLEKA